MDMTGSHVSRPLALADRDAGKRKGIRKQANWGEDSPRNPRLLPKFTALYSSPQSFLRATEASLVFVSRGFHPSARHVFSTS